MGTNHYPRTRANIHDTIIHWQNSAVCYDLCALPGTVIFAQDNDNDLVNGDMQANDGQKDPWKLSKVKCFRC